MPSLDDIVKNRSTAFIKKKYRAWDLSGSDDAEKADLPPKIINNDQQIKKDNLIKQKSLAISIIPSLEIIEQIGDNRGTIGEQSADDIGDNRGTIGGQSGDDIGDNRGTIGGRYRGQSGDDIGDNRGAIKWKFKDDQKQYLSVKSDIPPQNTIEILKNNLLTLTGIQLAILNLVNETCLNSKRTTTGPINGKNLSILLGISYDSLKTSIKRLREKKILSKSNGKQGRGGYFDLSIELETRNLIGKQLPSQQVPESTKKRHLGGFLGDVSGDDIGDNIGDNHSVVSSSSYNKITTTRNNIDPSLDKIDFSPLKEFGMGKDHIIQIDRAYKKNPENALDVQVIQNCIYALAYDLKHHKNTMTLKSENKVASLTKMLKDGNPYSSIAPEGYKTPQEEALHEYNNAEEKRLKNKQEQIKQLKNIEYQKWLDILPEEELLSFCSESEMAGVPEKVRRTLRRKKALDFSENYFEAEVWPSLKLTLLQATT